MREFLCFYIFISTSSFVLFVPVSTANNGTSLPTLSSQNQNSEEYLLRVNKWIEKGDENFKKEKFQLSLGYYQNALKIIQKTNEQLRKGEILSKIGETYVRLKQYSLALNFYKQALSIYQKDDQRFATALALNNIGTVYFSTSQYLQALDYFQKAANIREEINDQLGAGNTFNYIGASYYQLGKYEKAIEFLRRALFYRKKANDEVGRGRTFINIALAYNKIGYYPEAIENYQQALMIFQNANSQIDKAHVFISLGYTYVVLGQHQKAVELFQNAFSSYQKLNNQIGVGTALHNLGLVNSRLGYTTKSLEYYQQALDIRQKNGDQPGLAQTLNNTGFLYSKLKKYEEAISLLNRALLIFRDLQNKTSEGMTLDSLGTAYKGSGQLSQAFQSYQQALAIRRELGERPGERVTLSNFGDLLQQINQPELAILFYKQSVNVTEAIRKDLRPLPKAQQESYTQTVADTYRKLADLLLQQDRVLEAQQVLELLKVQELDDYLRNVRGVGQQIEFLRPEAEILKRYGKLQETAIQVGRELAELRKKAAQGSLTEAEKKRVAELDQLETSLNEQFGQFIRSEEVKKLIAQLSPEVQEQIVKLSDLEALRDDLRRMNAVMIYPLVLSDRLELIITTPDSIPLRRTVPVKREILNAAILEFRQALQSPSIDAKPVAQKLYKWLIEPLEADLKQATPQTIIYAPDGQLRYIPLAALHDGQQWLVQRYRINNITAKSLTKFNNPSNVQMRVLAGAFADAHITYPVKVGERNFSFKGLPFAGQEVTHLAALFPGTSKVLDRAFSLSSVKPVMNGFSVVHLATHAAFVPGDPSNSFILFGDGSFATLRDIENWSLNNVDLVVLSACETGVGIKDVGDKALGNGEEVLGLGYQFQSRGARAVIASLWSIHDGSTQQFMSIFYSFLKQGNITKAESLQQAQIALITNDFTAGGKLRGNFRIETASNPASISTNLSHPFYWAPFILIGNGL